MDFSVQLDFTINHHYQDYKNQEIDAVIELPDGTWCAFEIKLGANQINVAASNLLEIKNKSKRIPRVNRPRYSVPCAVWPMRHISDWMTCLWCRLRH